MLVIIVEGVGKGAREGTTSSEEEVEWRERRGGRGRCYTYRYDNMRYVRCILIKDESSIIFFLPPPSSPLLPSRSPALLVI